MSRGNYYPARVHYEYEQDENVKVQYAHGVWGGVTKHGEIELNFYLEHDKVLSRTEASLQDAELIALEATVPVHNITRAIHSRVLLNYQTARAVLDWLEDKVQVLELQEDTEEIFLDSEMLEQ